MKVTDEFVFFYSNTPYSNFYPSKFIVDDIEFNCGEQWIMYQKAVLFNDLIIANKILKTNEPKKIKSLGRQVANFNEKIWNIHREQKTFTGLLEKFKQNEHLSKVLIDTGNRELVEASPTDRIWGIGLAESDPRIFNKSEWLGRNILGEILMKVRSQLRKN